MKAVIGYHASHEQFAPSRLLQLAVAAEGAGFEAIMCSDHFHPWSEQQANSGFAWAWLGSAMQATSGPFGVVSAPGQRYNPAIVAQAAATLTEMYPDRFWLALGSGQNLNEHITGERWPNKSERNERLLEAAQIIRALWRGETVCHKGHFLLDEARLFTCPPSPPLIVGAAITPATARWVAGWADALITIGHPREELEEVVRAFREGGGNDKPVYLQLQVSYAGREQEALHAAHREWRTTIFESNVLASLRMPADFDAAAAFVEPEQMRESVRVSADLGRHAEWLHEAIDLGFTAVYIHNVHPDQETFIHDFGEKVLPQVRFR